MTDVTRRLTDDRSRGLASRLRWALMPWWAFAWKYRDEHDGCPNPGHWWTWCWGSTTLWLDGLLARLPGGALHEPMPLVNCGCDYCQGVPGAVFEP